MKLIFKDFVIDTKFYDFPVYVRDFDLLAFTTLDLKDGQQVTLNLCFDTPEEARSAYFRIRESLLRGTHHGKVDCQDITCSWPARLAGLVEKYNASMVRRRDELLML